MCETGKEERMKETGQIVLCGANSYEQKYFFNPDFTFSGRNVYYFIPVF